MREAQWKDLNDWLFKINSNLEGIRETQNFRLEEIVKELEKLRKEVGRL
jgi:hypothetical protein